MATGNDSHANVCNQIWTEKNSRLKKIKIYLNVYKNKIYVPRILRDWTSVQGEDDHSDRDKEMLQKNLGRLN